MNNLETNLQRREEILELINRMSDKIVPEIMRIKYHNDCFVLLEKYSGSDFETLMDKYLKAEWRKR